MRSEASNIISPLRPAVETQRKLLLILPGSKTYGCFHGPVYHCKLTFQWLYKNVSFSFLFAKMIWTFLPVSYGSWNLTPLSILLNSLDYLLTPTFVSSSNSFSSCLSHALSQFLCFNFTARPSKLHRRYLVCGHCFNHTNLSRSFTKVTVLRFKTTALYCSVLGFCYRSQPAIRIKISRGAYFFLRWWVKE